jgi:hypothetical protein
MAWHYLLSRVFERRLRWPNGVMRKFARRAHGPVFLAGRIDELRASPRNRELLLCPRLQLYWHHKRFSICFGATIAHIARIAEIVAAMAVNYAKGELESRR